MNIFAFSSILITISCILLGIIVFLRGKGRKDANILGIFCVLIAVWGLGCYKFSTTGSKVVPFIWLQVACIGITFTPVIYSHFVFTFLSLNRKRILVCSYVLALVWSVLNFFASELRLGSFRFVFNQFYWYYWPIYKNPIFFIFYLFFYWLLLFYSFISLLKSYKNIHGFKRHQLEYLIVASIFGWLGPHVMFLINFGVDVYPYSNFFVISTPFLWTYAIFRHHFLDIEVVIKKTLTFTGLFTIVYAVFAFFALFGQAFFEKFIIQNRWVSMIPSVIVVTLTLRPLESFLINVTDKYLFQKKYDYRELLKIFAADVLTVLDLDKLIKLTEEKLAGIMKLEYCRMVVGDNIGINIEAPLELPIFVHNKSIGTLLLGKKKSDEDYNQDDLDILQPLAKTLGIAIANARLVEELSKAQIDAAQKDKMATVGTLAAGMAHEIRNPITTIRVFSEYAPDRLDEDEFRIKYRNVVTKEVDKIDHIIQTLIDFSGEEDIQQTSGISTYEAVEELISIISQNKDISGRIQLINNISPDSVKISVNKEELDEIILNLTQNAIHAISEKGIIKFSIEERDGNVILEISDTGCGMSKETAKHIFDPFFTTRSKGFGLGLFVVKELVQRNKGEIEVESEIGKGTKFSLKFKEG